MTKLQFRVLYPQFLFRAVDLELLSASAQGDITRLLGQFAALLVYVSSLVAITGVFFEEAICRPPRGWPQLGPSSSC